MNFRVSLVLVLALASGRIAWAGNNCFALIHNIPECQALLDNSSMRITSSDKKTCETFYSWLGNGPGVVNKTGCRIHIDNIRQKHEYFCMAAWWFGSDSCDINEIYDVVGTNDRPSGIQPSDATAEIVSPDAVDGILNTFSTIGIGD